jgi:hypothetical protein
MAALVHRLRSFGSEMMAADEINYILRIQHMATHGGHPYLEDFYYQVNRAAVFVFATITQQMQQYQGFGDVGGAAAAAVALPGCLGVCPLHISVYAACGGAVRCVDVWCCNAACNRQTTITLRQAVNCYCTCCRITRSSSTSHQPSLYDTRPLQMHLSSLLCALQAYLNKYYGGRNALVFAPAELRDLASEHAAHEGAEPRFADLSGLGKIVLSNIRTPKMLMDVGAGAAAADKAAGGKEGAGQQGAEGKAKPLEQVCGLAHSMLFCDRAMYALFVAHVRLPAGYG